MNDNRKRLFPIPLQPGQSWQGMVPCDGMSLRDYFAAQAMRALLTRIPMSGGEKARDAYAIADAMLKAREK